MLNKFKNMVGKGQIKRKHPRADSNFRLCVSVFEMDKNSGVKKSGKCFMAMVKNFSAGGLCIVHGNNLLIDETIEIGNKHSLKRMECVNCPNMALTADNFASEVITGRVVWRTHKLCGIKFTDIRKKDQERIEDMVMKILTGDSKG
ncbi:PilZ domain-containing protein [Limisalsivibrio acetivorans]|uniref:PilZ domain-containing protein n=1 Tax=Limisalsivibrio acetivorans TaxID=1304888 RepID=UPI0003B4E267|nr:PilZ domain-containing protein [Limisalsivibrio acetivorans]